jgi:integrase/recombinase XerD
VPPSYRKSTGKLYLVILASFRDFIASAERPDPPAAEITSDDIRRWEAHRAETGHGRAGGSISGTTLNLEHRALKSFWAWALREGAIDANPMSNIRAPRPTERPVEVLTAEDYAKLLATANGRTFEQLRNQAILRFLWATGCRLGETAGLQLDDMDLHEKLARVTGKGDSVHIVAFNNDARRALDRYMRARKGHPHTEKLDLWLGPKGRLTESGVYQVVRDAATASGVKAHPHQFRHTSAHNQLAAGMPEQAVMDLHNWKTPRMLARYGASRRHERAVADYRNRMDGH